MRGIGETSLAALATLQIPAPITEQFVDPRLMRAMLQETFQGIDNTLDFADLASRLMEKLVPHFCTAGDLLVLESLVGDDEFPTHGPDGSHPLRRLAVKHKLNDPAWQAAFPDGEILRYPPGSPYVRCSSSPARRSWKPSSRARPPVSCRSSGAASPWPSCWQASRC